MADHSLVVRSPFVPLTPSFIYAFQSPSSSRSSLLFNTHLPSPPKSKPHIVKCIFTNKCSSFLFNTYGIPTKHVLQQTLQRYLFTDTYLSRRICPRSRGCDTRRWVRCPWRCRCHRVGKGHVPHRRP